MIYFTGYAITCFVCNSHNDTSCLDLPQNARDKFSFDCNRLPDGEKYTLCRKIDFYMDMDFGKRKYFTKKLYLESLFIKVPKFVEIRK